MVSNSEQTLIKELRRLQDKRYEAEQLICNLQSELQAKDQELEQARDERNLVEQRLKTETFVLQKEYESQIWKVREDFEEKIQGLQHQLKQLVDTKQEHSNGFMKMVDEIEGHLQLEEQNLPSDYFAKTSCYENDKSLSEMKQRIEDLELEILCRDENHKNFINDLCAVLNCSKKDDILTHAQSIVFDNDHIKSQFERLQESSDILERKNSELALLLEAQRNDLEPKLKQKLYELYVLEKSNQNLTQRNSLLEQESIELRKENSELKKHCSELRVSVKLSQILYSKQMKNLTVGSENADPVFEERNLEQILNRLESYSSNDSFMEYLKTFLITVCDGSKFQLNLLKETRAKYDTAENEVQALKDYCDSLRERVNILTETSQEYSDKYKEMMKMKKSLQSSVSESMKKTKEICQMKKELNELQKEVKELKNERESLKQELKHSRLSRVNEKDTKKVLENENHNLSKIKSDAELRVKGLLANISCKETLLKKLKMDNQEMKDKIEEKIFELDCLTKKNINLQDKLKRLEKKVESVETKEYKDKQIQCVIIRKESQQKKNQLVDEEEFNLLVGKYLGVQQ